MYLHYVPSDIDRKHKNFDTDAGCLQSNSNKLCSSVVQLSHTEPHDSFVNGYRRSSCSVFLKRQGRTWLLYMQRLSASLFCLGCLSLLGVVLNPCYGCRPTSEKKRKSPKAGLQQWKRTADCFRCLPVHGAGDQLLSEAQRIQGAAIVDIDKPNGQLSQRRLVAGAGGLTESFPGARAERRAA